MHSRHNNQSKNFFTICQPARAVLTASFAILSLAATAAWGQIPAPPQTTAIALVGGTIHTVSGETIASGAVLFAGGKITAVGASIDLPSDAQTYDVTGLHIYPGLIESHSQLGLTEIGSIPATIDHSETGDNNANARAQVAVNPDSEIIPVTRSGGVLVALTAPSGGLISGRSAVIQLDGWSYEDMTLLPDAALQINWPSQAPQRRFRGRPRSEEDEESKDGPTKIEQLRKLFLQARQYQALRATGEQPFDLRLESLAEVMATNLPVMIRADQLVDIESAVAFGVEFGLRTIILGGYDAPLCAELLRKHDISVIVPAVYRLPLRRSDPTDHAYTLPRRLHEAGIRFSISSTDRSETWNTRTLPHHAGTAVAFGLAPEMALRSVTLSAAEIIGVADRVGSLDVGKDATLLVTDGDPLDTRTIVLAAYIQGRPVDLSNKQIRLYEKYRKKYEQLDASAQRGE